MKIVAGPWLIKGRGHAVVLLCGADERADVGDRLRRADGSAWVLAGVEVGSAVPRGACILRGDITPAIGDELACIAKETT